MNRTLFLLVIATVFFVGLAALLIPLDPLLSLNQDKPDLARAILIQIRAPRVLLALTYGAALGASGAAIQALFANPLASPDLTGTTSGAALGAVVTAYLLALTSPFALAAGAIAGALGALLLLRDDAIPRSSGAHRAGSAR